MNYRILELSILLLSMTVLIPNRNILTNWQVLAVILFTWKITTAKVQALKQASNTLTITFIISRATLPVTLTGNILQMMLWKSAVCLTLETAVWFLAKEITKSLKCRLIYESETDCPRHISRLLRAKAAGTLKLDCEVFLHFCMTRWWKQRAVVLILKWIFSQNVPTWESRFTLWTL